MKLTTTVAQQINSTLELGVSSMRTALGTESGGKSRDVARCGTKDRTLACQASLLDARLDAIRRAGL